MPLPAEQVSFSVMKTWSATQRDRQLGQLFRRLFDLLDRG